MLPVRQYLMNDRGAFHDVSGMPAGASVLEASAAAGFRCPVAPATYRLRTAAMVAIFQSVVLILFNFPRVKQNA